MFIIREIGYMIDKEIESCDYQISMRVAIVKEFLGVLVDT